MKSVVRFCTAAVAVAGLTALMPSPSRAQECKDFAAVGSGLNESVATLMAKQGAVNVAEARDYEVQGEAKLLKCGDAGIFGTECTARVRACKRTH